MRQYIATRDGKRTGEEERTGMISEVEAGGWSGEREEGRYGGEYGGREVWREKGRGRRREREMEWRRE